MFDLIQNVFNTFGAAIFVPLVLFIIAKFMGVNNKKAFNSALLAGIGLTGFNMVIGSFTPVITPVVEKMVSNAGVDLAVLDTGWQAASIVAYSTQVGLIFFGIGILLQLILFFTKWTNIFMPSDLWNNYSFMLWGSMLYLLTGNMLLALALMVVQNLFTLLFAEIGAKRWSTYFKYPNCAMTAPHNNEAVPYAILMNWILNKLGLQKINLNATALQKKFGIFGEPMFLGLSLGALISIIGNFQVLNKLETWGEISQVAITTAAVMAIFPRVASIFSSAFTSLSDAYKKKAKKSGEGREWYIAVNDAAGYGEPNNLMTGIILIPIILVIAFILPGNRTLPLVDLVAIPYGIQVMVAMSNGNILKSTISSTIWLSFGLLLATAVAPHFTEVATSVGVELPTAGVMITSLAVIARPLMGVFFFAFLSQNPIIIGALVVVYFIIFYMWKKHKEDIVEYLETCNEVPAESLN